MAHRGVWDPTGPSLYAKARFLDPKLGRFLTQDSFLGDIDEPPSLHRYLYANANPTTFWDPTGHNALANLMMPLPEPQPKSEQAMEAEAQVQDLQNRSVGEVGKSIVKRISGFAHTVMEATGADKVLAVPARMMKGESLGQALENVAIEKLDPKGRVREARARGAGVLETAVEGAIGLYDAATDRVPVVGPLKTAFNSDAPLADRVEGFFDAVSQGAGLGAGVASVVKGGAAPSGQATAAGVREQIVNRVNQAMEPHLPAIQTLDSEAVVGFRGSLARGTKGPHKGNAPFDPSNFDVDAFIGSDRLASTFPAKPSFRAGTRVPEIKSAQQAIDKQLRATPGMEGLRAEPFTFRIFTSEELLTMIRKGDFQKLVTTKK